MCRNEEVCYACRKSREFRSNIHNIYDDIDSLDFKCPLNKNIIKPELPSLKQQATNLKNSIIKTGKDYINNKRLKVTSDEYEDRKQICFNCDLYREGKNNTIGRCAKCGCYLKLKIYFKSESCPINKW